MVHTFSCYRLVLSVATLLAVPSANVAYAQSGRYAAIAYSQSTGKLGHCKGHARTRQQAERDALNNCGAADAKIWIWGRDRWLAIAVADGKPGTAGFAAGNSAQEAQGMAIQQCRKHTRGSIRVALCIHSAGTNATQLQRIGPTQAPNAPQRQTARTVDSNLPQSPAVDEPRDYYAAVAHSNSTGRYGYCAGHAQTRADAERHALSNCNASDAHVCAWVRNGWLALAKGSQRSAHGWGWSTVSAEDAKRRALEECQKRTSGCYIAVCKHAAGDNRHPSNQTPEAARSRANDEAELGRLPEKPGRPPLVPPYFEFFQED